MDILCRKGFYPYECIDNDSKVDELGLPQTNAFYSRITQKRLTEEEYEHYKHVYDELNI